MLATNLAKRLAPLVHMDGAAIQAVITTGTFNRNFIFRKTDFQLSIRTLLPRLHALLLSTSLFLWLKLQQVLIDQTS